MKKINLLLLLVFSTHYISPMLIEDGHINSAVIKERSEKFLNNLFEDKTFTAIKTEFQTLPQLAKYRVLLACGDAKPIIMMAHVPHEQREEIASQVLGLDKKSAQLFCSFPINKALGKYQRAISKRQRYQTLSLPLGFCYRTSDDTCILLCNAIKSTKKEYFLKNEELKKLQKLLQEDPLVIEALGIKNEFFY